MASCCLRARVKGPPESVVDGVPSFSRPDLVAEVRRMAVSRNAALCKKESSDVCWRVTWTTDGFPLDCGDNLLAACRHRTDTGMTLVSDRGKCITTVRVKHIDDEYVGVYTEEDARVSETARPRRSMQGVRPAGSLVIQEQIGCGSFAVVYKVLYNGQPAAAKHLSSIDSTKPMEAVITKSLVHPNIVCTLGHEALTHDDFWIVLEYCGGGTLKTKMLMSLGDRERAQIIHQMALGMAYLHDNDVLHGDLSPANILFDMAGNAKIADFGLSRMFVGQTMQTQSHGTLTYTSPELLFHGKLNLASDVYAFGMLVYELCAGQAAYSGKAVVEMFSCKNTGPEPRLPEGHAWRELVDACLKADYQQRPTFQQILQSEEFIKIVQAC